MRTINRLFTNVKEKYTILRANILEDITYKSFKKVMIQYDVNIPIVIHGETYAAINLDEKNPRMIFNPSKLLELYRMVKEITKKDKGLKFNYRTFCEFIARHELGHYFDKQLSSSNELKDKLITAFLNAVLDGNEERSLAFKQAIILVQENIERSAWEWCYSSVDNLYEGIKQAEMLMNLGLHTHREGVTKDLENMEFEAKKLLAARCS